jgi:SAM-dependent methyltransferase
MSLAAGVRALAARIARRPSYQDRLRVLIATHAPGRSFVDVGCMWKVDGAYAFLAADAGATEVAGVDLQAATPAFEAENGRRGMRVRFVRGGVNDHDVAAAVGTFDVVFCSGVLYHVPNPLFTLARLRTLCRETLVLGTSIVPELSRPQAAIYYPHLPARARGGLTYRTPPGYDKIGLDTEYRAEWDYANYFWGLTPSCVEALVTTAGFHVAQRHRWRHALCVVCRTAAELPPNFATLAP